MRKVWILVCTLALVPMFGVAQTPSGSPLPSEVLAAILSPSAATSSTSCSASPSEAALAAPKPGDVSTKAICTIYCGGSVTVSCQTSSCIAYDRNCPTERGHAICDSGTIYCPKPCRPLTYCEECDQTGDCFACCLCDGGGFIQCNQQCR